MLVRCITGLALGLAVAFSFPAMAETGAKTSLFPMKSATTEEAETPAKGKKAADAKVIKKKKDAASAKADAKKKQDVAAAKADAKKKQDVAAAKAKKDKQLAAAAKAKKDKQLADAAKAKKDKQVASAKTAKTAKTVQVADARPSKVEFFLWGSKGKAEPEQPKLVALKKVPVEPVEALPVVAGGNAGELRSEIDAKPKLFAGLFGETQPALLPETRALDASLQAKEARKKFKVKDDFVPQSVDFPGYERGTIVIDTSARYLYLVESSSSARRYAIAVGREGLEFKGTAKVGDKQEWPRWIPTKEMQEREPAKYGQYKDGMNGGPDNPLGARAIYLYQGKKDTHIRIHGTNQPQTIGTNSSNGCFRMVNEHVMDLYKRVKLGTQVIVM